ncbi:MAG TPA: protein kinase [Bryobacteraceae bacterium]|nr:protein kinase [Bryobacteraceae bacterium]
MGDSDPGVGPEFTDDERELIKDLLFEGQKSRSLDSWLDLKNPPEKVRREVERLLRAAPTQQNSFLERAAAERYLGIKRELPARIGRYPITGEIGSGGMGVVYSAIDEKLNRRVAIKVLPARAAGDPEMRKRLWWDAQAASALQHPNIVTVYDVNSDDGSDYLVMEYITGQTLGHRIPRRGLPVEEALKYAIQIAAALEAAHAKGIVHRDVKPGNIMITESGTVKLLDFGLAKDVGAVPHSGSAPTTVEGRFAGTVTYVSPEQAEGKPVDARSDIFSFGAVLFEMVAGRRAFRGDSNISVLSSILRDDPPNLTELKPLVDPGLSEIVGRCLRKDRLRRFQSIAEAGVRLQEVQEWLEQSKRGQGKRPPSGISQIARRPAAWFSYGILTAAILAGLVGGLWWGPIRSQPKAATEFTLIRATSDAGLTESSTLSPDGKLLVFSSDRSGSGNLNIWVQQLKDGGLLPLTHGPENNSEPVFSPDSAKVAFRSSRSGGGVYLISSLGGQDRLVAPKGRGPQFSRDGQTIAYWTGAVGGALYTNSAGIYLVSVRSGGVPRKFRPDFDAAAYPVWSPGGNRLLFLGRAKNDERGDWWVADIDGTYARPLHITDVLVKAGLHKPTGTYWLKPSAWLPGGRVLFTAKLGDATNVWSVQLSEDGVISGPPVRLTSGPTIDCEPSAVEPNGRLVLAFVAQSVNTDVWQVKLDAAGLAAAPPKRLIAGVDGVYSPSISRDGSRVAYASRLADLLAISVMNTAGGPADTVATMKNLFGLRPILSGNGAMVAYSDSSNGYIEDIATNRSEIICEHCSPPTHVNFDGSQVLFESMESTDQIWIGSKGRARRPLIRWADNKLILRQQGARFSPDGRWVVFSGSRFEVPSKHIWITPVRAAGTVAESDLIPVTDGDGSDIEPYWSPDGRTIYFLSDRDGYQCIWARHVDPATARPLNEPFAVQHFHLARQVIESPSMLPGDVGLSVARDSLVFMLSGRRGNVWLGKDGDRSK